jgi:hypothetical protein
MKKFPIIILFTLLALVANAQEEEKFEFPTHEIYSQFVGEWTMIYANMKDGKTVASGRGESVSSLDLKNTILQFENEFEHKIGIVKTKYIIGYDVLKKKYYLFTYSSANDTPVFMYGEYKPDEKLFEFRNFEGEQKDGDVKVELKVARDDKVTFQSFVMSGGDNVLFLNIGFVRK